MIPLHRSQQTRLHQRQTLCRITVETDIITQSQNSLCAVRLHIVQHGLQGLQIRVNIR